MMVGADESRQNDFACAIYEFSIGKALLHFLSTTNTDNLFTYGEYSAVPNYAIIWTQTHHNSIFKSYCHRSILSLWRLLVLNQHGKFSSCALSQLNRACEAFLGADRAANAARRVGVRSSLLIEFDRQIRTARTVTTGCAEIVIEIR